MSTSFGDLLAKADLEVKKDLASKGVVCPLCGQATEFNGATWVCRTGHYSQLRQHSGAAYNWLEEGNLLHQADIGYPKSQWLEWDPQMQGIIIAIVTKGAAEGTMLVTRRGYGGATTFCVDAPADVAPIAFDDWELAPWIEGWEVEVAE